MRRILLTMITLSVVMMAGLSRSSAGVVTDSTTGLQWQDDYSDNSGNIKSATWQQAIDYCEALTLDGGRWRLPNIRELNSIVDLSHSDPAIDPMFQHTAIYPYWSASTREHYHNYAEYVQFRSGSWYYSDKDHSHYVRCVRSGE